MSPVRGPVICLGAAVMDYVLEVEEIPRDPIKMIAKSLTRRCGGPAATGAVALAALGFETQLWSCLGCDHEGDFVLAQLRVHGVGLQGLRRIEGTGTIVAFVVVDRSGERLIVAYGGRQLPRDIDHLPIDSIASAGAVLVDLSWPSGAVALLGAARTAGVPSVVDAEEGADATLLHDAAVRASLPVFSEGAFATLSNDASPGVASFEALARRIGVTFGVTLGARGSLWWFDGDCAHVPALPVQARDTTGAGDVFHGALAGALAERRPLPDAVRFATAAAGLKCALGQGWDGMPSRPDVEQAMRQLA